MYMSTLERINQTKEINGLDDDIKKYNIDDSYIDIEYRKDRNNFYKIFSLLESLEFKSPEDIKSSYIKFSELKRELLEILDYLFDRKYHDEIVRCNTDLLQFSTDDTKEWDNAVGYYIANDKFVTTDIQISKNLTKIEIPFVAHEYIHVLLGKYQTLLHRRVLNNYHYDELLPIIVEYIVSYELDQIQNERLFDKDNLVRLNHNRNNVVEYQAAQKLKIKEPFDDDTKKDEEFLKHVLYQYLICDIFSTRILELYKEDKKDVLKSIMDIIDGKSSINELKQRYNIFLRDSSTKDAYIKKLINEEYKRI